ncbi:MAG TPA: DUF1549 domain-containing protein, partial [Pirellulaceae bacterium]|nr:DUF1549 domain-containing protein [Pirellulaceae bacterium]
MRIALLITSLLTAITVSASHAEDLALEPINVGTPSKIEVFPAAIKIAGARRHMQLVVTGHYADGTLQDLTRAAQFATSNAAVAVVDNAVAQPKGDGAAEIVVTVGGQEAKVPVEVSAFATPQPISFEFETLAALSKQGCNSGACHGSPSGKGGFRLSLRAFDPSIDKLTLIREDLGRRTNPLSPEESLLLNKPLMKVPHGGGLKLKKSEPAFALLRQWIAEGCQPDKADAPRCVKIEVYPPSGRVLKRPAHTQQLAVLAHFADGTTRDVTDMACYSSSDSMVAEVNEQGLVVGHDRGEAAIIIRYLEHVESCFLTFVKDIESFAWNNPPTINYIDEHVDAKLQQLKYLPSGTCSDEEFLRRVHLDVIGQLPTLEETQAFLADGAPDKRAKLIDNLLDRPEYARFFALKWGDLLRLTTTQIGGPGAFKYHRWVQRAFESNMPYDQFAHELLAATGSTLNNPAANFYRTATDTQDCVESISQIFLGARLQCAKCHNHPFEKWTQDNYYGMAAFFNRVQRKKSPRADE